MINQWKGLHKYYNMEIQVCEFHKIKVAKAQKIRPWDGTLQGYNIVVA